MDIITQLGALAIGSRLKRLSDQIMQDGAAIYQYYQIDFNPAWFPVFYCLSQQDRMGVMEIAHALKITHPGVIKTVNALERKGYVDTIRDDADKRKRMLQLSEKGRGLLPKIEEAWSDIAKGIQDLLIPTNTDLLQQLIQAEQAFEPNNLLNQVKSVRQNRLFEAVKIIDFRPELAHHFRDINVNWISQYFKVEQADLEVLENPQTELINKGGWVLFAEIDGQVVGTCALKKFTPERFELIKMGVVEGFRGRQIGKKLALCAIEKAKDLGCKVLFLESNKQLEPAIRLYRKLGFVEVDMGDFSSAYIRADIRMEMQL